MDNNFFILEHMEEGLSEWSHLEIIQMINYLSNSNSFLIITNCKFFLDSWNENDIKNNLNNIKTTAEKNNFKNKLIFEREPIKNLIKNDKLNLKINNENIFIDFKSIILLDFRAEKTLKCSDKSNFNTFIVGGILGDNPPKDRSKPLRDLNTELRKLGDIQLSSDTAILMSHLVINKGLEYENIPLINHPEFIYSNEESVQLEGFSYVSNILNIKTLEINKNIKGEPIINETIKNELLREDFDLDDFGEVIKTD